MLVDRDRVEHVFSNLIANAVHYTPANGAISLGAKRVDGFIRFVVSDTGEGIAPQFHQRIFEKFFRADDYLTREVEGTGLGLAFARYIAKVHNGEIRVTSQVSSGSTFTLQLRKTHVLAE